MIETALAPPFFESDWLGDPFIATFLFHPFLGPDDLAWLANFRDLHLSDEDARALIFLRETGTIHNAAYRMLNWVDALTASGRLRNLRDAHLLEQKGRSSATYYLPGQRFLVTPHPASAQPPLTPHTSPLRPEQASLPMEQASLPMEQPPLGENIEQLLREMPPDLRKQVNSLRQRTAPAALDAVVERLCGGEC